RTAGTAPGTRVTGTDRSTSTTAWTGTNHRLAATWTTNPVAACGASATAPLETELLQGSLPSPQPPRPDRRLQERPEVGGPGGYDPEGRSAHRVAERQKGGMEGLPGGQLVQRPGLRPPGPGNPLPPPARIDRIPHDRVTDRLQVNPDLVCPPGVQLEPEEI